MGVANSVISTTSQSVKDGGLVHNTAICSAIFVVSGSLLLRMASS